MILTDRDIRVALAEGLIEIEPRPDEAVAIGSIAIDLTRADTFKTWKDMPGVPNRPGAPGFRYSNLVALQVEQRGTFGLTSRCFALAWTVERVAIPIRSRLAARVEGKSSLARLGISIHVTAPVIHCGFTGQIQLEMFNFGPYDVLLVPGMYVCQLVFEQTAGTPERARPACSGGRARIGRRTPGVAGLRRIVAPLTPP